MRGLGRIMAVLAAMGLLACGGPRKPGDAADLVATLPADVDLVAFVNVEQVREHPLFAKLRDDPFLRGGDEPMKKLQQATGLDPLRDFHMLLFVTRNLGREDMEMAIIARGDLDRERLEDLLEQTGWKPAPSRGLEMYQLPFDVDGLEMPDGIEVPDGIQVPDARSLAGARLAFLDDFTIALGSADLLEAAAAVRSGDAPALVDTEDMGMMVAEGLGSGQFWGAFRSAYLAEALRERLTGEIPALGIFRGFSGVQGIRFSMRFSDSIDLVARAHTATEADAELLADTLNGFLALAQLFAKDQPELLRFLQGALVGLDLDSVRLSMNVDAATLDRIRGGWLEQIRR